MRVWFFVWMACLIGVPASGGTPPPAEPASPSSEARVIQTVVQQTEHPVVFTGVVRSRVTKEVGGTPYWFINIRSVKTLLGAPRASIQVVAPCVFYFRENAFHRVTSMAEPPGGGSPYLEKPQVFLPGDRVFMVAHFFSEPTFDKNGSWIMTLNRFLRPNSDTVYLESGYRLNAVAADSLGMLNRSVPPDSMFVARDFQMTTTTLTELKSLFAAPPARPETAPAQKEKS